MLVIRGRESLDALVVDVGARLERLRLLRNGAYDRIVRILRIDRIDRNRCLALKKGCVLAWMVNR